jgi:DNA-binding transcriptional LysR family regulator
MTKAEYDRCEKRNKRRGEFMSNSILSDAKLRYLAEAAALGSMHAASEKLDVAVSSISRQIAQLESELGLPLIERGRRALKLTQAGEMAVTYYRESITQRETLVSSIQALRGLRTGQVELAVGEGFVNALSLLLQSFAASHPGLRVSVKVAGTLEVMRQVRDDEAHIGLAFHSPPDPRINVRATFAQPIRFIAHPRHALCGKPSVTLREVVQHRLCLPEPSFRIGQMINLAGEHERVSLDVHMRTNSLQLLREMVKSGMYATLLPEIAAVTELSNGELVAVPIESAALQDTALTVICRLGRTLPSASATFLPMLEGGLRTWLRKTHIAGDER